MSVADKYLTYRGEIRALAASGKTLIFVTEHPEGRPTGVYRLDCESFDLATDPLPTGGRALCLVGDEVWVGGSDGSIHRGAIAGGVTAMSPSRASHAQPVYARSMGAPTKFPHSVQEPS